MSENKAAIVFGASGVSGWPLVRCLLNPPSPEQAKFSRILAFTHRPMSREELFLHPEDDEQEKKLEVYAGIDLASDDVRAKLSVSVPRVEEVTHVFFCAFISAARPAMKEHAIHTGDEKDVNVAMVRNTASAVDSLCPRLDFFLLQTGTNAYGVAEFSYLESHKLQLPLSEDQPRIPLPFSDNITYYGQVDALNDVAKGKSWSWCETRPDAIVGFCPSRGSPGSAEMLGLPLALYRYVNGSGASIRFPGSRGVYDCKWPDSGQDELAAANVYLATKVKKDSVNARAFNVADRDGKAIGWARRWAALAEYWGLTGEPPDEGKDWDGLDEFWKGNAEQYKRMCKEFGLRERNLPSEGWEFMKVGFKLLNRDRELNGKRLREVGFSGKGVSADGAGAAYERAWAVMQELRILPPRSSLVAST